MPVAYSKDSTKPDRAAVARPVWLRRAAILAIAVGAAALLIKVTIVYPIVHVRWAGGTTDTMRVRLEQAYGLVNPEPIGEVTFRYLLLNIDTGNVERLVRDAAVADTQHIDRETFQTAAHRQLSLRLASPSVVVLACGLAMLWIARSSSASRRKFGALGVLASFSAAVMLLTVPETVRMGDAEVLSDFGGARETTALRIEAHLSYALLEFLGRVIEPGVRSMERVQVLTRGAGLIYAVELAVVMGLGGWSAASVRYAALALAAPVTFTYFGYVELGALSLTALGFPLLLSGLQQGSGRLDTGAAVFGLRAALHSFGLLSLLGSTLAALGWEVPWRRRVVSVVRLFAYGSAFYLIWLFFYLVLMKVQIEPGHATAFPLRSLWTSAIAERRLNVPIMSGQGMRDVGFSLWLAGLPLVMTALMAWRTARAELRAALLFMVPSVVFTVLFWPIQGLAVELDLLLAAFPAVFGLLYVSALGHRSSWLALAILTSMHAAMWYVLQDPAFVNEMTY